MYSTNERMRVRQVLGRASFILVLLYGITMKMIEPPRLVAKDYYLYISMSWCCVFLKRGWTFANLPSTTRFILHLRRWLDVCTQAISHLWIIQVTRIPIHCDPATIIRISDMWCCKWNFRLDRVLKPVPTLLKFLHFFNFHNKTAKWVSNFLCCKASIGRTKWSCWPQ